MTLRASATYHVTHADGIEEEIEIEVATDANYSPDLADDLITRAKSGLAEAYHVVWPATVTE